MMMQFMYWSFESKVWLVMDMEYKNTFRKQFIFGLDMLYYKG